MSKECVLFFGPLCIYESRKVWRYRLDLSGLWYGSLWRTRWLTLGYVKGGDLLITWATVSLLDGLPSIESFILSTTASGQGPEMILVFPGSSLPHPSIRPWQSGGSGGYHKPLTAEDRGHSQALCCGICTARSNAGAECLGMFGFSL